MKYLAFDIETAKVTTEGDDLQQHRPLGIACWAVAWQHKDGEIISNVGYGMDFNGNHLPKMTRSQCCLLVARLHRAIGRGYTILTHNGVGFDFDILGEESGMVDTCAEIAMQSVDVCLQVYCMKGFPVGLDAIAKGMGLQGKAEGMDGSIAPQMWADGRYDEVLTYVAQDARSTLEVALEAEKRGALAWISKSRRANRLDLPNGLLTVQEALRLPEPNTSWMDEPIPRSRFVGWMDKVAM